MPNWSPEGPESPPDDRGQAVPSNEPQVPDEVADRVLGAALSGDWLDLDDENRLIQQNLLASLGLDPDTDMSALAQMEIDALRDTRIERRLQELRAVGVTTDQILSLLRVPSTPSVGLSPERQADRARVQEALDQEHQGPFRRPTGPAYMTPMGEVTDDEQAGTPIGTFSQEVADVLADLAWERGNLRTMEDASPPRALPPRRWIGVRPPNTPEELDAAEIELYGLGGTLVEAVQYRREVGAYWDASREGILWGLPLGPARFQRLPVVQPQARTPANYDMIDAAMYAFRNAPKITVDSIRHPEPPAVSALEMLLADDDD